MATGITRRGMYRLEKVTASYTASENSLKSVPFPSDNNPWTKYPTFYWVVVGFTSGTSYNIVNNIGGASEMMVVYNTSSSSRSGTAILYLLGIPRRMLGIT